MEQIVCSETSAYIIQTPENYPKENIIYSEHGESFKSRIKYLNFLCFVDRASLYNLVNKATLMHNLFLVYRVFINLYMFRATMGPSWGETTVFVRHLILIILCGWLSGVQEHMLLHTRLSYINLVLLQHAATTPN